LLPSVKRNGANHTKDLDGHKLSIHKTNQFKNLSSIDKQQVLVQKFQNVSSDRMSDIAVES
jgi:hypothetical protein